MGAAPAALALAALALAGLAVAPEALAPQAVAQAWLPAASRAPTSHCEAWSILEHAKQAHALEALAQVRLHLSHGIMQRLATARALWAVPEARSS